MMLFGDPTTVESLPSFVFSPPTGFSFRDPPNLLPRFMPVHVPTPPLFLISPYRFYHRGTMRCHAKFLPPCTAPVSSNKSAKAILFNSSPRNLDAYCFCCSFFRVGLILCSPTPNSSPYRHSPPLKLPAGVMVVLSFSFFPPPPPILVAPSSVPFPPLIGTYVFDCGFFT